MFISLEICLLHKTVGREILHFSLSDFTNTVIRNLITLLPERNFNNNNNNNNLLLI